MAYGGPWDALHLSILRRGGAPRFAGRHRRTTLANPPPSSGAPSSGGVAGDQWRRVCPVPFGPIAGPVGADRNRLVASGPGPLVCPECYSFPRAPTGSDLCVYDRAPSPASQRWPAPLAE